MDREFIIRPHAQVDVDRRCFEIAQIPLSRFASNILTSNVGILQISFDKVSNAASCIDSS